MSERPSSPLLVWLRRVYGRWLTISSRQQVWATLCVLELILASALVIPFVIHNNLLQHDMVGHLSVAAFTRDYLFPRISGFNPFFYCGVPENELYPPLLAYLSAALGQWIPVALALKLLVAVSVLGVPLAIFACARAHGLPPGSSLMATLAAAACLALDREEIGGTFWSTFTIGNLANAVALPLFMTYAGSLAWLRRRSRGIPLEGAHRPWWTQILSVALPALLLTANLLAHLVGGIMAGLLLLAHAALAGLPSGGACHRMRRVLPFLVVGGMGLAQASFFLGPLLAYQRFGSLDNHSYNQYPDSLLRLLLGGGVLIAWYARLGSREGDEGGKDDDDLALAPLAVVSGLVLVGRNFVFNDYFPPGMGLHVHRFKLYDGLLLPILAAQLMGCIGRTRSPQWRATVAGGASLMAIGALVFGVAGIDARGVSDQAIPALPPLPSRVMVLSSPWAQASDHAVQHLVPLRTKVMAVKGLFIEAAANARYLLNLERLLAADSNSVRVWGIDLDTSSALEPLRPALADLLSVFGIGYVVTNEPLHDSSGLRPLGAVGNGFTLYQANETRVAEVWRSAVDSVSDAAFRAAADRWFFADQKRLSVVLGPGEAYEAHPSPTALKQANVMGAVIDPAAQTVTVDVAADEPVPVLVKMSYSPHWVARDFFGKSVPLYRVTPGLVLLVGRGRLILNYERTRLQTAFERISAVAWLALIGSLGLSAIGRAAARSRASPKSRPSSPDHTWSG